MTSRSNNVVDIYVKETTFNTTPVDSPDWKTFPLSGAGGIGSTPTTVESTTVRSDRGRYAPIKVSREVTGTMPAEFRADEFDQLIEAAFMSAFSTGVLSNASTKQSFTFERQFTDLTTKYLVYSGVRVNGFTLTWAVDQKAEITFDFMGIGSDSDNVASLVGSGTLAPVTANRIMSVVDVSNITVGGTTGYCVESFSLTVTNNMESNKCAGSANGDSVDQLEGSFSVTGNMTLMTTDNSWSLIANKDDQTAVDISFDMSDGTTTYNHDIHEAYVIFPDPSGQGLDTSIPLDITFSAAQNETESATYTITKS